MGITEKSVGNVSGLGRGHIENGRRTTRPRYQKCWTPRGTSRVVYKGSEGGGDTTTEDGIERRRRRSNKLNTITHKDGIGLT